MIHAERRTDGQDLVGGVMLGAALHAAGGRRVGFADLRGEWSKGGCFEESASIHLTSVDALIRSAASRFFPRLDSVQTVSQG
jgi:hypothetical protein